CRSHVHAALSPAVVLTSTEEAVRIANHKTALFEFLSSHSHLLPDFRVVGSAEEALGVVERLVAEHGAALVKSDASTGGRGMFCVGTPPEERAPSAGRSFMPIHAWRELARSGPALRAAVAPSVWGQGARWPQL